MADKERSPQILILATEACAYPGANSVGQAHSHYADNTFILRVREPAMFPEKFYMDTFDKGIGGIIIMSCGVEDPYEGGYDALAKRYARILPQMRERGWDIRRLRLTAICTVCNRAFLNEVKQMQDLVTELGRPGEGDAAAAAA